MMSSRCVPATQQRCWEAAMTSSSMVAERLVTGDADVAVLEWWSVMLFLVTYCVTYRMGVSEKEEIGEEHPRGGRWNTMLTLPSVTSAVSARPVTTIAHTHAVERAIQVMRSHLREPLALADLASAAYLSPAHFNRVFRRQIGVPPGEYLTGLRLQTARQLLLTTSLSVTDICYEVGYTSTGSFTTRFTQLVGASPRHLRQRAHEFTASPVERAVRFSTVPDSYDIYIDSLRETPQARHTAQGWVSAPAIFQGIIYVALFTRPIPQGSPVRCARLHASGYYRFTGIPDGIYYLLAAAFPVATDLRSHLLPGEHMLVGGGASPLIMRNGYLSGDSDLVLRAPRLTDPPLVMALPRL